MMNAQSKLQDAAPTLDPDAELVRLERLALSLTASIKDAENPELDRLSDERHEALEAMVPLQPRSIVGLAAKASGAVVLCCEYEVTQELVMAVATDANRLARAAGENPSPGAVPVSPSNSARPVPDGDPRDADAELARILERLTEIRAAYGKNWSDPGVIPQALIDEETALEERLAEIPAASLAGLAVKCRAWKSGNELVEVVEHSIFDDVKRLAEASQRPVGIKELDGDLLDLDEGLRCLDGLLEAWRLRDDELGAAGLRLLCHVAYLTKQLRANCHALTEKFEAAGGTD